MDGSRWSPVLTAGRVEGDGAQACGGGIEFGGVVDYRVVEQSGKAVRLAMGNGARPAGKRPKSDRPGSATCECGMQRSLTGVCDSCEGRRETI